MSKSKQKPKIKAPRDMAKTLACQKIAQKYKRSVSWAYKVSNEDDSVKQGQYYTSALNDYNELYKSYKEKIK